MEQKYERHWLVFLGIWGLAALAPLGLFAPIFGRTFSLGKGRDGTRPDIYLELLEADIMQAAVLAILLVALLQSVLWYVRGFRRVILPQLAVWVLLGLGLAAVNVFKPQPPPLEFGRDGQSYSVPRVFTPKSTFRSVPRLDRRYPVFSFYVCQHTVEPAFGKDCESTSVHADWDRAIGEAFANRTPETAFAHFLRENDAERWQDVGRIIAQGGGSTLIELPETSDGRAWVNVSYLTLDENGHIIRFASCRKDKGCFHSFETDFGFVSHASPFNVSHQPEVRASYERALVALIESWES